MSLALLSNSLNQICVLGPSSSLTLIESFIINPFCPDHSFFILHSFFNMWLVVSSLRNISSVSGSEIRHTSQQRYTGDPSLGNTLLRSPYSFFSFLTPFVIFLPYPLRLVLELMLWNILLWMDEIRSCFCMDKLYSLLVPQWKTKGCFLWAEAPLINTGPKHCCRKALMSNLPWIFLF